MVLECKCVLLSSVETSTAQPWPIFCLSYFFFVAVVAIRIIDTEWGGRRRERERERERERGRKKTHGDDILHNHVTHTCLWLNHATNHVWMSLCITLNQKKNHRGDASWDIEESAVWFRRNPSMCEVTSRIRSRFRSWIKHPNSSISQDFDFMHHQHGSFFFVQGSISHTFVSLLLDFRRSRSRRGKTRRSPFNSSAPKRLKLVSSAHTCISQICKQLAFQRTCEIRGQAKCSFFRQSSD